MAEPAIGDGARDLVHAFKNHLAIVVGFCDLAMASLPAGHPARHDVAEINRAGQAALQLLPELAARLDAAPDSDTPSNTEGG